MFTLTFIFLKSYKDIIEKAVSEYQRVIPGPHDFKFEFYTFNEEFESFLITLTYDDIRRLAEILYLFGEDTIRTRSIMEQIISKLCTVVEVYQ